MVLSDEPVGVESQFNWTFLTGDISHLTPITFVGRFRAARRAIDAPRVELSPVDNATTYDIVLSPITDPALVTTASSTRPIVDLSATWPRLPFGMMQMTGRAFGADGQLLGVTSLRTIVKAPDWKPQAPKPAGLCRHRRRCH